MKFDVAFNKETKPKNKQKLTPLIIIKNKLQLITKTLLKVNSNLKDKCLLSMY